MKFKNSIEVQAGLKDSTGSIGSIDQVLTSTGTEVSWRNLQDLQSATANSVYYDVKNSTGVLIPKGTGVMAVGTTGNSGTILVAPMVANGTVEGMYYLGILSSDLANGVTGKAVHFGRIDSIDTSAYTDGTILWCNPAVPGGFTITEPQGPNLKIAAAFVISAATNGKIFARFSKNEGLHEMHDVNITSQSTNDVLSWNNATSTWKNKSIPTVLGYTPADAASLTSYLPLSGGTLTGQLKGPSAIFGSDYSYATTIDANGVTFNNRQTGTPSYPSSKKGFTWNISSDGAWMMAYEMGGDMLEYEFGMSDNRASIDRYVWKLREWSGNHNNLEAMTLYPGGSLNINQATKFNGDIQVLGARTATQLVSNVSNSSQSASNITVIRNNQLRSDPDLFGSTLIMTPNASNYTGSTTRGYIIKIKDSTSTPNTFCWGLGSYSSDVNNPALWIGNDIPVSTAPISLDNGVTIYFNAITGGVSGDSFGFTVLPASRLNLSNLTASQSLELDASKNVISVAKQSGYNLPLGTTAGTVTQGNDSRLSDARIASDVYAWAKATVKPSYTKSEVGLSNVDNTSDATKSVLSATKLTTARTINGVSFDGTANIAILDGTKETAFSKNTAFNKNFGTSAGTVTEGNDSRINNGQTAFTWGNHAGLYSLSAHTHTFASITSKPTTLSGYGITDNIAKLVATSQNQGSVANKWYKVATISFGNFNGIAATYTIQGGTDFPSYVTFTIGLRTGLGDISGVGASYVNIISKSDLAQVGANPGDIVVQQKVANDYTADIWIKNPSTFRKFTLYELSRGSQGTFTYYDNTAFVDTREANIFELPSTYAPSFNTKGYFSDIVTLDNLTASTILELDSSKRIISATKNSAYNKSFGTTAGTVAEGNKFLQLGGGTLTGALTGTSATFSGTVTASGDVRAPIFYDSNNTGYYVNPAGSTKISQLTTDALIYGTGDSLSGIGTATTWDPRPGAIYDRYVIGNHTGISLHGYPGYGGVRLYSAGYPTLTSSILRLEASDAVYTYGILYNDSSMRAPIFYDRDNTGYYVDPSSTSNLNVAQFASRVVTNEVRTLGNQQLVLNAGESWAYSTGQGDEVVYINAENGLEINSSPDNWTSGWAGRITARINDSSGKSYFTGNVGIGIANPSVKLDVVGDIHIDSTATATTSRALRISNGRAAFGYDGSIGAGYMSSGDATKPLVFRIGTTEHLRIAGNGNIGLGKTNPLYKLDVLGTSYISGDATFQSTLYGTYMYGQIFYDVNDSMYYVDPASTSNINNLTVAGTINGSVSGSSGSTALLSTLGAYSWNNANTPSYYQAGTQLSFVQGADGWPSYGSVITDKTYGGGGGTLQTYVPYSPSFGGTGMKIRFGNYDVNSGNSWTNWKTVFDNENYQDYTISKYGGSILGSLTITTNTYTQTLYDSDNTAYYVDPAGTSNINAAITNGSVSIGSGVTTAKLDVTMLPLSGKIGTVLRNAGTGSTYGSTTLEVYSCNYGNGIKVYTGMSGATNVNVMAILYNGTSVGAITTTASSTVYATSSDYRLKENVVPMTDSITRVKALKPSKFNFISNKGVVVDGFIAHEVQAVIPEAVTGEKDELDYDGNPKYQGIDQSKIVPLLTAALQEAIDKIDSLEKRISILENK